MVDNGKAHQTLERAQTPPSRQPLETLLGLVFPDGHCLHDSDNGVHSATEAARLKLLQNPDYIQNGAAGI